MKIITKKLLSIFLSALMLVASLPIEVLAQAAPSVDLYDLTGYRRNPGALEEMIQKGYTRGYENFADIYIVVPTDEAGRQVLFPVAREGEYFVLDAGNNGIPHYQEWSSLYKESSYLPEGYVMRERKMVRLERNLLVDGEFLPAGTYIDVTEDIYTVYTREQLEKSFVTIEKDMADKMPALSQKRLAEILEFDKTGRFFGEVDTYAKFARVQAQQAKGGEEIVTVLADGLTETRNVAKAGDYIITNPGGERYIVPGDKFAKKYEAAMELGEGWYKPTGKPQQFRQLKQDMVITASWGEKQVLRKGSYVNVTDLGDLYGVAEREFDDTYKTIKALYRKNFNGIQRFVSKIEERLYAKYPRYQGVFFKRFLKNDVKYMEKRLEQRAARAAARNSGKKAAGRTALRTFGGVALGIGLYLGITLLTAPSVEAQNIQSRTRSEAIRELQADVANNAEKTNIFEKTRTFVDPNYAAAVITDAISGDGALLEEMGTVEPTIEATGVNEDELIEAIVDEAVAEDEEEVRIPFVNPNTQNNPISNFGSFQYQHN